MNPKKKVAKAASPTVLRAVVNELRQLTENAVMSRAALMRSLLDVIGAHDIDKECGYPLEVTLDMYQKFYLREGLATRVVSIFPHESWTVQPTVFETQKLKKSEQTPFELAWNKLWKEKSLYEKLSRLDEVSGIGHYGILLLGFDDGRPLETRVEGVNENGESNGAPREKDLLYIMPFDEGSARIRQTETRENSPRFGLPRSYNVKIENAQRLQEVEVHWSRVIHVADNCKSSEVYGTPRLEPVFNRVLDAVKIMGSSAEMFWKGGFPGISFEVPPELASEGIVLTDTEKAELKEEIEKYMNSIKRYLSLVGVTAKQLQVNIADPDTHLDVQIMAICVALGVPRRIFLGSEEARLASIQDNETWNKKVLRRQNTFVTPRIIRPFVDRMMAVGVLPTVEEYFVEWPDLYAISELDRADVGQKVVRALAEYVTSGAKMMVPPMQFLTMILDFELEEAEAILEAAEEYIDEQVSKGLMLDPKEEIRLQKEQKEAGIEAQKNKGIPGAQGFKGGQNQPKRTRVTGPNGQR